MKRKKMLVMATVFAMLFGLAQIAVASIPTPNHFVSTDGDATFFGGGLLTSGCFFGVYDFGDDLSLASTPHLDLLGGGGFVFEVTQSGEGNTWVIKGTNDFSINIGPSSDFSFYFWNDSTSTYDTDFTITLSNGFLVFSNNDEKCNVLGIPSGIGPGAASTPLPGSAIFLFSGIMGLVAFGSRRKIMK